MLQVLESLLYRAECGSIIVGGIINVVNHGVAQRLFDKHAITCVTDTRRQRCPRRSRLFVTAETALGDGERPSRRSQPWSQSAIITARRRSPARSAR